MFIPPPKIKPQVLPRQTPVMVIPSYIGEGNVVGAWLFYSGAESVLHDFSGEDNDGDLINAPTWADGRFGWSLEFNGSDQYGHTGDAGFPYGNATRATLAWVRGTYPNTHNTVFSYGDNGYTAGAYGLDVEPDGSVSFLGQANDYYSSLTLPSDEWHLIGCSYPGGTDIEIFLDKSSEAGTLDQALDTGTYNEADIASWRDPPRFPWTGSIALLWHYSRDLTASEVSRIFEETRSVFGA